MKKTLLILLFITQIALASDVLGGTITTDLTLDASIHYLLDSDLIVSNNATLTIPAGTKINANFKTNIIIKQGAKIYVNGTNESPVIISANKVNPTAGFWGGLHIFGSATTSVGENLLSPIGYHYGGSNSSDNSGSITNLILIGTGAHIDGVNQANSLSLYAVGNSTIIKNIGIYNCDDDGVQFHGGNVNTENIYIDNANDDAIDWNQGWSGTCTNTYIKHTVNPFSSAIEGSDVNNNPKFINLTAISTIGGRALEFRENSGVTISNLYLDGYTTQIYMKNNNPISNIIIDGTTASLETNYNTGTPVDISGWSFLNGYSNSNIVLTENTTLSTRRFNLIENLNIELNNQRFTVSAKHPISQFTIYNLIGQTVKNADLKSGIYILEIIDIRGNKTIIKQGVQY